MRKIRIATAGAVVIAVVLAASTATYAATHSAHPGAAGPLLKQHQVTHQITSGQEKLKNTVIASGFSGVALTPGGFTPLDAGETITCAGSSTCTIEADMSIQAQGTGSSNAWAICLYVVDLSTYATCPYYGFLDSAFFENGTQIESISGLPAGSHTVQTQVFSSNGGTAYNYSLTYHAYKP
jgi:hypothetical protein